ncbi:uncharacterized protein PgNI_04045 [Pyricularia grisea]|uniref:WSC domain-containing protein n=1 Tax=Pyricularia grisea TaxID=148305 RepID=A0A6P8BCC7_PYRGI|nr:uncharacterized protein PgNI_04045 [Pyricularia grisea]TLD13453.1 hypothetical protein PgNI_04045 [Pyricularia grisea]
MLSRGGLSRWAAMLSTTFLLTSLAVSQSIPMDYCATINTGTGQGNHSDWQSDGLCSNFCKASNSGLAIVQGSLCWCSNIMPSDSVQVGTDKCKDPCPGYPSDVCGGDGTWGYMRIKANPITATSGGSSSTSTTDKGNTVTGQVQDSKPTNPSSTAILTTTITALPPASSTDTTGQQHQTTSSPPQVETVTADGTTRIVTVAPTGAAGSSSQAPGYDTSQKEETGGGLGTGAAVGIAVGVISILVAGGIIGFVFLRRKRRQDREAQEASSPGHYGGDMSHPTTGFATRRPTNGTWGSEHSSGRRSSMPDPRMKSATGIYPGTFINRSRESFESMQDNLDYSRPVHHPNKVLRVANPSPGEND